MGIILAGIVIAIAIFIIISNYNENQSDYDISNANNDYKPLNLNNKPISSQAITIHKDIDNSYAFANRLKNLIFSRRIDEQDLISYLGISAADLKKYKFTKGLPPYDIVRRLSAYFNVDFTYLAEYKDNEITVFKNDSILYKLHFHYPSKARFDNNGNCIFVDYVQAEKQEYLIHLSSSGKQIGTVAGLHSTQFLKIKKDGRFSLAISEIGIATLIDLHSHTVLKQNSIGISSTGAMNVNIKDLQEDNLILRFIRNEVIDFTLDFNFYPIEVRELIKYHAFTKDAPRFLSSNYYTILEWIAILLPSENLYVKEITDVVLMKNNQKYFSSKKLAKAFRSIGEKHLQLKSKENAIYFFEKAIELNPNVGVKTLLRKLKQ